MIVGEPKRLPCGETLTPALSPEEGERGNRGPLLGVPDAAFQGLCRQPTQRNDGPLPARRARPPGEG